MLESGLKTLSAQFQSIEGLYTIQNPPEVVGFLDTHPHLLPILAEAPDHIHQYFPNAPLGLSVFSGFQSSEYNHLVIDILTTFPARKAVEELDKLDNGWWGDQLGITKGNLSLDLAFGRV